MGHFQEFTDIFLSGESYPYPLKTSGKVLAAAGRFPTNDCPRTGSRKFDEFPSDRRISPSSGSVVVGGSCWWNY